MLDIDLSLMLFVLVLFLILLAILNQMLYKPLLKFMDDRDSSIAKDLEYAKSLSGNSQQLHNEADGILDNAKVEAGVIRKNAIDEAKVLAESRAETKQNELNKEYSSFIDKLQEDKEKLKVNLLSQMPLFKESLKAKFSKL